MVMVSLVMILMCVLCADAKRWYSASEINKQQNAVVKLNNEHDSQEQEKFKRYAPVIIEDSKKIYMDTISEYKSAENFNWKFKPTDARPIANLYTDKSQLSNGNIVSSTEHFMSIHNNIEDNNVVNITKPRRRFFQRRCPMTPRRSKQVHFNDTSRGRFLEVFEVVQFHHLPCTSSSGLEGTCLHEYDCQNTGGSSMGSCADEYGTCCVILFNCDGNSAAPVGWFTNPGFPSPTSERLSCTFILNKSSEQIKQVRLDFMTFEILPPVAGICEQDQFLVTGQNVNSVIPILCGINTGQHVYIDVSEVDGPITLSIQTVTEENRLFSIKVSQLTAYDSLTAPTGCLQFFKEPNGHLESFNYKDRSEIGITRSLSYLNNLNYAMCIERAPASCTITYTNVGEMQIVNYDNDCLPVIPPRQAGVEIFNCPSDWLLIAAVRLCGERLNDGSVLQDFSLDAPVTDDGAGPIIIWFRSDSVYAGRGFKLYYQQNSCTKPN